MHAGTIKWNGLDLSRLGKPKLGITKQPDPPAPAYATRQLVTLKVTVDLEAMDAGTIHARASHLQNSLKVTEGILSSETGSGYPAQWLAQPGASNLSAVLAGRSNTLEMTFTAVENHSPEVIAGITAATFTPAGSDSPITLNAMRDVKEDVNTERHSPRASARTLTTTTISFTARIAQADAADPLADRLADLQTQAAAVKAIDCREGLLVFGGISRIVRVTEFTPLIDEARGVLDLRVQCFSSVLPDNTKVECDLEMKTRLDAGSGEQVLTYSGTLSAATRTIALAKLESIRAANAAIAGRRTVSFETSDKTIKGADTEHVVAGELVDITNADWTGSMTFTLEMRQARDGGHYNLKITSSKDIRQGMRWNYSGSITAASSGNALALARSLVASTGHPIQTKSEETLEHVSDIYAPETRAFVKLDFSYDFEGPSDGFIGGEISTDRNLPLFGEYRRVVSGFLIAKSRTVAEGRLILLLADEGTAIEQTLKWSDVYLDEVVVDDATGFDDDDDGTEEAHEIPKRVFQKLEFSAGARVVRTRASVKFTDSVSSDISTMLQQRTVTGSIWTDSQVHSETVLAELIVSLFGGGPTAQPTKIDKTHSKEKWGNATQVETVSTNSDWVQLDFSLGRASKLTGTIGYDIIKASYTMERVGSLNNTVITPVPFDRPVAQVGTGYFPGSITINASCQAIVGATARAWVQGKLSLVDSIGTAGVTRHMSAPPRESMAPEYEPFSGSVQLTYNYTGNYQWTFTGTVLDGLWPSGFGGA